MDPAGLVGHCVQLHALKGHKNRNGAIGEATAYLVKEGMYVFTANEGTQKWKVKAVNMRKLPLPFRRRISAACYAPFGFAIFVAATVVSWCAAVVSPPKTWKCSLCTYDNPCKGLDVPGDAAAAAGGVVHGPFDIHGGAAADVVHGPFDIHGRCGSGGG